jgi:toxin ParE1/3/4
MAALNYLPAFEDDTLSIWNHIAKDNPTAADELVDKLHARCLLLVDHPLAGPARPDIAKQCRHLTLGRYLILHRYKKGQVNPVRVLDGRRKISGKMFRASLT